MSREEILASIKKHKPAPSAVKTQPIVSEILEGNYIDVFLESIKAAGGEGHVLRSVAEIAGEIDKHYPARKDTYSNISQAIGDSIDLSDIEEPHQLKDVDLVVLQGDFGVAENGAIWVSDSQLKFRVMCFITQQLILVINRKDIVATMHQGYERVSFDSAGFGCFIAGPSKTADIEQSLVIGAHGARGLMVYIIEE